jgi:cytoskeletal protein RodZ
VKPVEEAQDDGFEPQGGSMLSAAPDMVEVRRNGGLAALIGAAASAVAIAYLGRAAQTGAVLDWLLFGVMGVLGVLHLHAFVDARTPLLVADAQGVRIRLGRAWRGMPWGALASVEHTPRPGFLRDGRLVLVPRNADRVLAELDPSGRRQSKLSQALYGAPFALPLGLSTHVSGTEDDLTTALRQLAGSSASVVELVPGTAEAVEPDVEIVDSTDTLPFVRLPDPRPFLAHGISVVASVLQSRSSSDVDADVDAEVESDVEPTPIVASATPAPLREPRAGTRTEVRAAAPIHAEVEGRELRRHGSINLVEEAQTWGDRVRPIAQAGDSVEPLVIDDFEVDPAADPVIGPELLAARTRIGLTVDQLAERTRIRPHVIESIEVDDFAPCGGDFYARGHLRTLARILGVDAAPLLSAYNDRYADAPINPRRVFEAELATGASGGIRSTRGGPNWSLLMAAVMVVVLAWSIARLLMDEPPDLQTLAPVVAPKDGSGIPNYQPPNPAAVTVVLTTGTAGTHVEVIGKGGEVVLSKYVGADESHRVRVVPPVRIKAQNGAAVSVKVDGQDQGILGGEGERADEVFRVKR